MKRILLSAFFSTFVCLLFSQNYCIKNRFSNTPLFSDAQIQKDSNIVFAVAKHWNSTVMDSLRMDIYYPNASVETLPKRPLIVFAFGGGFLEGNRFDMAYFCKEFAKRGYVTATIDYRIGWNCLNGTAAALCLCNDYIGMYNATYRAMQDFNASLRFLSYKSAQYKIDTNFVFVSGGSAGSITAMNAAFTSQQEIDAKLSWVHSQLGSIDSSGNTYPKNYKTKGVLDFCGAVYDTSFMNGIADIPIVSFHDSADCVVPAYRGYIINCTGNCYNLFPMEGSALIYAKAIKSGTCAELNINPAATHCGSNQQYVIKNGACFLKRVLCNSCSSARYKDESKPASCDSMGFGSGIENPFSRGVAVYPNPTQSILNIELQEVQGTVSLSLYDINGRLSIQKQATQKSISLDVSNLSNGVYFLSVQSKEQISTVRVIIQR